MRKIGLICMAIVLLGSTSLSPVWARGGHHGGGGFGLGLGLGLLGGYGLGYGLGYGYYGRFPYYPPYYGYPPAYGYGGYGYGGYGGYGPYGYPAYGYAPAYTYPPVIVQQQPQVIQAPPQAPAVNYWHYCRKPEGYYPYVKNCPGGWLQVAPQPAQ